MEDGLYQEFNFFEGNASLGLQTRLALVAFFHYKIINIANIGNFLWDFKGKN